MKRGNGRSGRDHPGKLFPFIQLVARGAVTEAAYHMTLWIERVSPVWWVVPRRRWCGYPQYQWRASEFLIARGNHDR